MDLMSPYLHNAIFAEKENEWNDENSIYQQNITVGCYPMNKLLPDTIASSRFESLGIPIGLVYYDTRPVYYVSKQIGGYKDDNEDEDEFPEDEKREGNQEGGGKEKEPTLTTLNMLHQTGGKTWFDDLVGKVVKEFGTPTYSGKTRKSIRIFHPSESPKPKNKTRKTIR